MVKTKSVYHDPVGKSDGTRILVMRRWPRGVRREAVDEWERDLAPSQELLTAWNERRIDLKTFFSRYRQEMKAQSQKIKGLAKWSKKETITLLCWEEDESQCHRGVLKKLIEAAK